MKKSFFLLGVCLIMGAFLAGCNNSASTDENQVTVDEPTVSAKIAVSEDQTPEEIENQISETCAGFGGVWEDGSCVLEDGETVQF